MEYASIRQGNPYKSMQSIVSLAYVCAFLITTILCISISLPGNYIQYNEQAFYIHHS
jgi:hypothetical protein